MLLRGKSLKRTLRTVQWLHLLSLSSKTDGFFLFYGSYQLSTPVLNQLFLGYGPLGFTSYLLGHSWTTPFWPRQHPAYAFLRQGSFYALYWPSWKIWLQALESFPFLKEIQYGLLQGHFFLSVSEVEAAKSLSPAFVCLPLLSVWEPLFHSLFLLTAQLVSFFPEN
jgi:hypothetical protein